MKPAPTPIDELSRLEALERYAALESPPTTSFDDITRLASLVFDVPIALVSMVDAQEQWFKARHGLDVERTGRDISFCGHAILGDDVMVVLDAKQDDRFADNPLVLGPPHIRFYAGAPLRTPTGHRIGTLCLIDPEPRAMFSTSERATLAALASLVVDEFELQLTTAELRARDADLDRYYKVMGASTDYMGLATPDGIVIGLNPAARSMVGLTQDEPVEGRPVADFHSPETTRRLLEEGFPHAIAHGSWRAETDVRSSDGRIIPVDQVLLCHRDDAGEVAFFSTIARDISDRNEIARLEQLRVMKDEFVSTVSHELRTPLTSVIASLELLADGVLGEMTQEASEVVGVALVNSRRLIRLVDELLDLERLQDGTMELTREATRVDDLVRSAVSVVAAMAESAGVSIRVDQRVDSSLTIECDVDRIRQVLVNLLGNAVKFSARGSDVIVRVASSHGSLMVSVIDEGIGIEPGSIPKLFDPFWQVDSSSRRTVGGTGLGLAISLRIVEQHDGRIEVESEPGKGSTFLVILPLTAR